MSHQSAALARPSHVDSSAAAFAGGQHGGGKAACLT